MIRILQYLLLTSAEQMVLSTVFTNREALHNLSYLVNAAVTQKLATALILIRS